MRVKVSQRFFALLCCAVLLSSFPARPRAAQAQPRPEGVYTLDEAASDDVDAAIKSAVKKTPFYARGSVADELKKNTRPYKRVEIRHTKSEVSVTTDQWEAIKTAPDGTEVNWTRPDGEKFRVGTVWEGAELKQTFAGEKGRRVNVYSLGGDGKTLTLSVTVTNDRWLKQPLTYKLIYKSGADAPPSINAAPEPKPKSKPRRRKG